MFLVAVLGIWLGTKVPAFFGSAAPAAEHSLNAAVSPKIAPAPTVGVPVALSIPKIGVNVSLESVGTDSQGRMDVPKNAGDAAWYNLGYKPGEIGNAVIDGHLDTPYGPSIFYGLSSLTTGDKITVTDSTGQQRTFQVSRTVSYPYDQLPLQQIFGPSTTAHLNLITCGGTWNGAAHNYSNRVVVYTDITSP